MSAFNDYLRHLIKKRNISISELARMTQIERTALQKSLTGDRVLPYDSVKTLSSFLQLTLSEKKKLLHYYNELFESEDVRESRKIISNMFLELAQMDFSRTAFKNPQVEGSLQEYIKNKRALILKDTDTAIAIMAFNEVTGSIDFFWGTPTVSEKRDSESIL